MAKDITTKFTKEERRKYGSYLKKIRKALLNTCEEKELEEFINRRNKDFKSKESLEDIVWALF